MAKYKAPTLFLWNNLPSIPQFYIDYSLIDFIFKASEEVLAMHKLCVYKTYACTSLYLL